MAEPDQDHITKALEDFVNAQTWDEKKHIVETQRETLLTDAADLILAGLIVQYRGNTNTISALEKNRYLLTLCRRVGVEVAFAHEKELQILLSQINQLGSPIDMPRRIMLCQTALQLLDRDTQPQLWADLQGELATSLAQNPLGERAGNQEQAILYFQQALEVYMHQAIPVKWARVEHNLGNAYRERIRGVRANNQEQAILHSQRALEVRTRQAFPVEWAMTENSLALAYADRIRGERAENLEQAILHYQQALEVFTRQALPRQWAMAESNLGNAYRKRIRGERADNLEQAISHLQRALEVYIRQAFPVEWAITENNLGNAYRERIRGERADNLEQAILHYQQSLEVRTRQAFPVEWAETENNLGNAYQLRIRGERAENLEQAILHYQQALEVSTRQALPELWAMVESNLGDAYQYRILGERAENQEQAILHLQQALEVRTRQAFPVEWAETENNLAIAYINRILGERAENQEQAIHHYQRALEVYTRQAFPEQWARTENNLGNAYTNRIRGERADNLEQAILHLQQALEVYTRRAFPEVWAGAENNLALAYINRILGERAENLEQAIRHYQRALEVYTRQAFPEVWAGIEHNLGNAYQYRILGERAENLEQAIRHFQQALEVRIPMTFPQDCRNTAYALGCLLYDEGRFSEACQALSIAHQAVEALRGEMQRDVAKRSVARENADLYARLVSCCLREEDEDAAFKYAVAGKGRAFVDLLATARFDLSSARASDPALADDLRKARELRQQIDAFQSKLTGESGSSLAGPSPALVSEASSRSPVPSDAQRAQLRTLQAREIRHWDEMAYKYPALTATQKAPLLSVDQACALAAELNATLVEYYRHNEGWCAFVVTARAVYYVLLPNVTDNLLERMAGWRQRIEYPSFRNQLSILRLSEWYEAVVAPIEAYLPKEQLTVLAPFGPLHVLPMAAARHPQTGRYIAEDYLLAFAPSLSALSTMLNQIHHRDSTAIPHRLLNVAYPGAANSDHYLPNVLLEAETIARHFTQVTPLYQENATPEQVLMHSHDQDTVHFGCHGWFDAEQPEESGLMLKGGWLTVQRIITELRLEQAFLATLGACLSGRSALQGGDEHVGLLQAMLTTGVQVVVASLWSVDDAATRVLFEAFYTALLTGSPPARAMQEAARIVREHPGWEHPYYWAAFQVSGVAHKRKEHA